MLSLKKISQVTGKFLLGVIIIPLNNLTPEWKETSFAKIKPNKFSFSNEGLLIEVNQSSSPLFYNFGRDIQASGILVQGWLTDLPEINRLKEGIGENDDFSFRLGFIETDDNAPSWTERLFMADWVTDLLSYLPQKGLKKIRFFTISQCKNPGTFRIHPQNKLIEETVVLKKEQPGKFKIEYHLKDSIPARAIWIQPDGDGSKSRFQLNIQQLEIQTEDKNN